LGFDANSSLSKYPKVFWKGISESGQPIRIKIEINTYERTPALPLTTVSHSVSTENNQIQSEVIVFHPEELIATKIRALYQRSKGRDLFDIWLSLEMLALDPLIIINAFAPYRPEGITAELAIKNLEKKLENRRFIADIDGLSILRELDYNPRMACDVVIEKLLRLL
jgi:predicted nucleotidyltransferase component of viral defense system